MADGILPFLTVYLTVFNAPSPCKFCKARYILRLEYVSQMRVFLLGFLGVFSVTIYCKELFTVIWKENHYFATEFKLKRLRLFAISPMAVVHKKNFTFRHVKILLLSDLLSLNHIKT